MSYLLTPFTAWFIAGTLKFVINSIKAGQLTFGLIGYGGMPSNHSAIVSSIAALIAMKSGVSNGLFGLAVTVAFIVILDARDLRRHVGRHATAINKLARKSDVLPELRERMGHTASEIMAGMAVGIASAWLVDSAVRSLL